MSITPFSPSHDMAASLGDKEKPTRAEVFLGIVTLVPWAAWVMTQVMTLPRCDFPSHPPPLSCVSL